MKPLQYSVPDTTDSNCPNYLVLQVVGIPGNIGHVPLASNNLLVGGGVISDQVEDSEEDLS